MNCNNFNIQLQHNVKKVKGSEYILNAMYIHTGLTKHHEQESLMAHVPHSSSAK